MKKCFLLVLTLVFVFAISGCSNSESNGAVSEQTESATESKKSDTYDLPQNGYNSELSSETESRSTVLVVYFSRTGEQYGVGEIDKGNTAIVAEMIANKTGADMFEILHVDDHYPMTYDALTDVAKQEQNDNARPEYLGEVPDLSQYDTVFIGAPVWWGDWPMIMYTFFENEDLLGKTLVPFSTHGGSGLSGFDSKLSAACPESNVSEGLAVTGTDAQNNQDIVRSTVEEWLSGIGY
ncbi:MAG: flavodoxin [Lachnospiraceae bacterium]|nr:flavodoxin [Lachnospiraceae bacterium]